MNQLQSGQNPLPGFQQTVGMVSHQDIINALDSLAFGQPTQFKPSKTKSKRDSGISLSEVSSISDNNTNDSEESEDSNEFCGMIQVTCIPCPPENMRSSIGKKYPFVHLGFKVMLPAWLRGPTIVHLNVEK